MFIPHKQQSKVFLLQVTRASYINQALTPPTRKLLNFFI